MRILTLTLVMNLMIALPLTTQALVETCNIDSMSGAISSQIEQQLNSHLGLNSPNRPQPGSVKFVPHKWLKHTCGGFCSGRVTSSIRLDSMYAHVFGEYSETPLETLKVVHSTISYTSAEGKILSLAFDDEYLYQFKIFEPIVVASKNSEGLVTAKKCITAVPTGKLFTLDGELKNQLDFVKPEEINTLGKFIGSKLWNNVYYQSIYTQQNSYSKSFGNIPLRIQNKSNSIEQDLGSVEFQHIISEEMPL